MNNPSLKLDHHQNLAQEPSFLYRTRISFDVKCCHQIHLSHTKYKDLKSGCLTLSNYTFSFFFPAPVSPIIAIL